MPRRRSSRLALPGLLIALALVLSPSSLWGEAAAAGSGSIAEFFLVLAAILVGAKLMGDLAERIGQPAVLGELLAGVLLGTSVLGIIPTEGSQAELLHLLAEFGVVLLLFEIGLETDLNELFRVGKAAAAVAATGVILPFALGFAFWMVIPHDVPAVVGNLVTVAVFVGATLTATSVGITARVLDDLKQMSTVEAKIILGAAVIDDILGLVILAVVTGVAAGASVTVLGIGQTMAIAFGFVIVAVVVGKFAMPRLFNVVDRMRVRHVLVAFAIAFALLLGALADLAGSAMIIGAFAAGLVLSETNQFDTIQTDLRPVTGVFTPIFFVSVGSQVDLSLIDPSNAGARGLLLVALGLTVVALIGKVVAGWAAPWRKFNKLAVGIGMVPRGEVGLIFADIGRRTGVLAEQAFNAVVLMVMATTFIAPIGLKLLFGKPAEEPEGQAEPTGE